ncbi:MmcQ/YjbR family DNA-binding protein [Lentibacillus sp. CBA3610]|uniref:MmcQ/YjbR family DNA-binding protein n=1 Tax=Lentibacillus sp. CBA3610 TaxID=2518176 RepID=UPI001595AC5B|nr:MmcQ/YjbR family DNA-binding protein [Lentibacillus sp. CBA3610]QKY71019.1 MmcQ/YjbR family DNA-binding protein [Lentibacillus sp. CBA3610]
MRHVKTRDDIFKYVREKYDTLPDYPFKQFPNYAVLRHATNRKWYGLVMNVHPEKLELDGNEEIEILNLKCSPELNGSLRKRRDILPAHHMNKEHWYTLVLERTDPNDNEDIHRLIEMSFNLTK